MEILLRHKINPQVNVRYGLNKGLWRNKPWQEVQVGR